MALLGLLTGQPTLNGSFPFTNLFFYELQVFPRGGRVFVAFPKLACPDCQDSFQERHRLFVLALQMFWLAGHEIPSDKQTTHTSC